jgi:transcriptional regulator with XRE-family HTH domain
MRKLSKEEELLLKKIGERIVKIRKEQNINQVKLGDLCDIEKPNMRRLEAGKTNATILTLKKICKALKIHLKDLLDFEYKD